MPDLPRSFLDISRSVTGREWRARLDDDRPGLALAQGFGLPEIVGRVLAARGVTAETCETFLAPSLRASLPDPSILIDMDRAAERIARSVTENEGVAILGDYDVDGATSTALWTRFLRALGREPMIHIPDRIKEGYGPNGPALRALAARGAKLVITVDCGTTAFAALEEAREAGLDVIVVDHHAAETRLPPAHALVNPNRLDDTSGLGTLCAAGVCFLTVVAVNRSLRRAGFHGGGAEPNPIDWLDLVALGTVCDVVPLVGLNRVLTAQGLRVMAKRGNVGLAALADQAGLSERPDAHHAGFTLGPRVNAGGRVGGSDLGARLLSTEDPTEAATLARALDAHNAERKEIEVAVLEEALSMIDGTSPPPLILLVGENWHPGVVGIVAGRLRERFHRPVCVGAIERAEDGRALAKTSGRSIPGIDLGAAVIAAREAGLLIAGGGHRMAAGFTFDSARIEEIRSFLTERVLAAGDVSEAAPILELDGAVTPAGASIDLVTTLERVAPFGTGNPEPRFVVTDAHIVRADVVGERHVRCILSGAGGGRLKAVAFRALDTDLGRALLGAGGRQLHLAGALRVDRWNGRETPQLFIEDAAFPR